MQNAQIHLEQKIFHNGVEKKNIELDSASSNGNILYVKGHYNNKHFRYINPKFKKSRKAKRDTKTKHVTFLNPISSSTYVGMPTLPVDSKIIYKNVSKKRRKSLKKKNKKDKEEINL